VLQDAVRTGLRFGSEAGTIVGLSGGGAPGCLADYAVLDAIANRLQGSIVDTSRVRSIFIYAAADGTDAPETAPSNTSLPTGFPGLPPHPGDLYGDYYYANYDTGSGADVDYNNAGNPGTGHGAIYKLFHNNIGGIFNTSWSTNTPTATPPDCGSTLPAGSAYYPENGNNSGGPTSSQIAYDNMGNWPPFWRNNQGGTDASGNEIPPDRYAIDIVYDYQFKTPLFSSIFGLFGGLPYFRMDEHAAYYFNPQ
jgi:hypothetical protein